MKDETVKGPDYQHRNSKYIFKANNLTKLVFHIFFHRSIFKEYKVKNLSEELLAILILANKFG